VATTNLLERAHVLASDGSEIQARISVDLAEQLIETGGLARVEALLSRAERAPHTAALAALTRFEWMSIARPREAMRMLDTELPRLLARLSEDGDERALARAHLVASDVYWVSCQAMLSAEQALLADEQARRVGDGGLRSRALWHYLGAVVGGPQPANVIQERVDVLAQDDLGPCVEATIAAVRGELARLGARFEVSRRMICDAIEHFRALGLPIHAAACHMAIAKTERSAQNLAEALAWLREADRLLAAMDERGLRSTTQAMTARVCELLGDTAGARAAMALTEDLGGPDDVINQVITHEVRARLALADGDAEAAEGWARSAVKHADRTDFAADQAETRLELARVLAARKRRQEACSQAGRALEIYRAKGDQPGAAEASALLLQGLGRPGSGSGRGSRPPQPLPEPS
ncbi:MAG TPA: hypothetical protein VFN87_22010, partial [Solirubrobacteraceae bacterium]|nr:hypothetical protein [Solirubrobacteraceae bacterium]